VSVTRVREGAATPKDSVCVSVARMCICSRGRGFVYACAKE